MTLSLLTTRITSAAAPLQVPPPGTAPHDPDIFTAAFPPGGGRPAPAGEDRAVRIRDAESGENLWLLKGYGPDVPRVTSSPERKRLAPAGKCRVVRASGAAGRAR